MPSRRGALLHSVQRLQRRRGFAVAVAQRHQRLGQTAAALAAYQALRAHNPDTLSRLAGDYAACALAAGEADTARQTLQTLYERQPGIDLLRALALLDGTPAGASPRLLSLLREQPSLSGVLELLDTDPASWPEAARPAVREAVARTARPQQRYRCAACGFEAQRHFWQCPGCLSWDSFPPQRIEEQ